MKTYLVQWSIDIEAETPREAAEKAREIQLDQSSYASVFNVSEWIDGIMVDHRTIDLDEEGKVE